MEEGTGSKRLADVVVVNSPPEHDHRIIGTTEDLEQPPLSELDLLRSASRFSCRPPPT